MFDYDWPSLKKVLKRKELEDVQQSYIICSSPCGGGEILGRLLRKTGKAGLPHYFFHNNQYTKELHKRWDILDENEDINYVRYLHSLQHYKTSENGTFGVLSYPRQALEHNRILSVLPKVKWIIVRRRDWAAQAVDGVEMSERMRTKEKEVDFLYGKLIDCLSAVMQEELLLRRFFQPREDLLEIYYEDLSENPLATLLQVASFMDLEMKIKETKKNIQRYQALIPKVRPHKKEIYRRFRTILKDKNILHS